MKSFRELVGEIRTHNEEEALSAKLDALNDMIYPRDGLCQKDSYEFFRIILNSKELSSSRLVPKWAHLVHTLLTVQNCQFDSHNLPNEVFMKLHSLLQSCSDPIEPLYAMSALVKHIDLPSKEAEGLVANSDPLFLCLTNGCVPVQRAALDCLSSLCCYVELSPLVLNGLLESLMQLLSGAMEKPPPPLPSLLHMKFQFSILRTMYHILGRVGSLQPLPLLPILLAALKGLMTTGLPGHHAAKVIPLSPHPDTVPVNARYQSPSVAGPRQRRQRKKAGSTDNSTRKDRGGGAGVGGGGDQASKSLPTPAQSGSEGEDSERGGRRRRERERKGGVVSGKPSGGSRAGTQVSYFGSSASESEPSDSDASSTSVKDISRRIRLHSLMCLSTIFQSLDRHSAFSYGLPFLPDSPRAPSSPPTLLTCLCKDPVHKCRSAAAAVLNSILDGSRPFMAVADDKPSSSRPFTAYSYMLGGVIQELHHNLTLSVTTEHHPLTLTQLIKSLAILVANTPYQRLSRDYIGDVVATIKPLTDRPDTDVTVGSLTCFGAILSLSPPIRGVEVWLKNSTSSGEWPWIVKHCVDLIQTKGTAQSLQMEAIQVLNAIIKFYFHVVRSSWAGLSDLYCKCMSQFSEPLQQHSLRFLEELGRALASEDKEKLPQIVTHWEALLSGPLTRWLQEGHTYPSSCAQACSVVATVGNNVLEGLRPPTKVLVQTVLLGLSKDENSSIKSSALRSLGVLCQYQCLSDDPGFLLDCSECIKEGLVSSQQLVVRTQAGWAIGNLTDSIGSEETQAETVAELFPVLMSCVILSMKDNEKVKVNAVRASGNLLKILTLEVFSKCGEDLVTMSSLLTSAVNSGGMKTRWNACYACHNALKNECFTGTRDLKPCVYSMLEALCTAVTSCTNFKVRTNAALALSSPSSFPSHQSFVSVWAALLKGMESSNDQQDFAEYKQANALRKQLCLSLCLLIARLDESYLQEVSSLPLLPSLVTHLDQYVQEAREMVSSVNGGNSLAEAVEKAHEALKRFDKTLTQEFKVLEVLLEIFTVKEKLDVEPTIIAQ